MIHRPLGKHLLCSNKNCINRKDVGEYCSDCSLSQQEKEYLYAQCINCIETYNDPYRCCRHGSRKKPKPKRYMGKLKTNLNVPSEFFTD